MIMEHRFRAGGKGESEIIIHFISKLIGISQSLLRIRAGGDFLKHTKIIENLFFVSDINGILFSAKNKGQSTQS